MTEDINITIKASLGSTTVRETPRGRLVKANEVEVGWVRVTDRNRAAAKAEATRQLQTWIDASDGPPKTVRFKESAAVLTAVPTDRAEGFGVAAVYTGILPSGHFYFQQQGNDFKDWDAAKRYARRRLVSNWVDPFDDEQVWEAHDHLIEYRQPEDAAEIPRDAGFQRAHRAAPEGTDAHTYACEHEREFIPTRETAA
jgi:hypothetical protein